MGSKVAEEVFLASKQASQYFEKIDKSFFYHAGALMDSDWFLCSKRDETSSSEAFWLKGLAPPDEDGHYVLAIPNCSRHTASELHQIVRELVTGLYIFNQTPSITLESNFDNSMTTSLPSAYVDTFLGQTLFTLDYYVKSLVHGSTIPLREKRARINEKWRKQVSECPAKLHALYTDYGLLAMEEDSELSPSLYKDEVVYYHRYPSCLVDYELAIAGLMSRLSSGEDQSLHDQHVNRDVFLRCLDQCSLGVMLGQSSIQQDGSLLVLDPTFDVFSKVVVNGIKDKEKQLISYLHTYLQKQISFVSDNLTKKSSIAHIVELLQFASFIVLFLATLKQNHKTVHCHLLQSPMNPDLLNTDREVPPFLPTPCSQWSPYTSNNHYTSAHGSIEFHKEQIHVTKELDPALKHMKGELISKAMSHMKDATMVTIGDQSYTLIVLKLDDYYPKFPRWIHAMVQELKSQCLKLPPVSDTRVQDFLRRYLGRSASKLKTMNALLRPCIEKGLVGLLAVLLKRCTKTRLSKPEDDGMALIHYAAAVGQSEALSLLIHYQADPHQPCQNSLTLPIHLATQSGDLDSVCCLLQHGAQLTSVDDKGWSPIHYAAYHNYYVIIKHFVNLDKSYVNMVTTGAEETTPLLLAAQNGGLDSIKFLLHFGADLSFTDSSGHNIVNVAAMKHHTNILQYLVELNNPQLPLWETLAQMLKGDPSLSIPQNSACALDSLIRAKPSCYESLHNTEAVQLLITLAKSSDEKLQFLSVQVLADISHHPSVQDTLVPAIPVLVKHLSSSNDRLQSCACISLNDLALVPSNKEAIAAGLPLLIKMLQSQHDDIQLYSAACLGNVATDNMNIKALVRKNNGIPPLIGLLNSPLMCIQGCAAASLQVLVDDTNESQLAALADGIVEPIVSLLKSKATSVHTNAAKVIDSLANGCPEAQLVLKDETCLSLLRRLLKSRISDVKVCGASALWSIAGSHIKNRRLVANFIGIDTVVDLMTTPNDKLYYVCSEALGTLATELGHNQNKIADLGGVLPLVDILLCQSTEKVYISVLQTLELLLTKPGLVPNHALQKAVADNRGLTTIAALVTSPLSEVLRVKAACTLAKLTLNNPENEAKLSQLSKFSPLSLVKLLGSTDTSIRLLAGYALSIYVFNNPKKLQLVRAHGSLNISNFTSLLSSQDETHRAHGAFQLVILAKLLIGIDSAEGSIHGIKLLVQLAASQNEQTQLHCCDFLACLARCDKGIPVTTVMAGAVTPLLNMLLSQNPPLEEMSSIALGYFTYQPLASRLIRSRFRSEPELYRVFQKYLKNVIVSRQFMSEWMYSEKVGLPSLSLEKRGGPAIGRGWRHSIPSNKSDMTMMNRHKKPLNERLLLHSSPSLPGDYSNPRMSLLLQRKLTLFSNIKGNIDMTN